MFPCTKAGRTRTLDKAQLQVGAPACVVWVVFDLLRERHPAAPEIRGLLAGKRVSGGRRLGRTA